MEVSDMTKSIYNCLQCQTEFTPKWKVSKAREKTKKFCSTTCRNIHIGKARAKEPEIITCLNCQIEFIPKYRTGKNIHRKFCSESCSVSFNNKGSVHSEESKRKIAESLEQYYLNRTNIFYKISEKNLIDKKISEKLFNYKDGIILLEKKIYKKFCNFKFGIYDYPQIPGYDKFLEYGMWHPVNNPSGMTRDHILSKNDGWQNNIDPEIISHPANCQFLSLSENSSKSVRSDITETELKSLIEQWK